MAACWLDSVHDVRFASASFEISSVLSRAASSLVTIPLPISARVTVNSPCDASNCVTTALPASVKKAVISKLFPSSTPPRR